MGPRPRRLSRRRGFGAVVVAALVLAVAASSSSCPSMAYAGPDCGPTVARADGTPWRCVLADDFSGTELDTRVWSPMTTASTGVITPECRVDSPRNIRVLDGTLRLTVRREAMPLTCMTRTGLYLTRFTGGAVTTYNKFAQAYGRFEIRASFPVAKVAGLHSALWMWPQGLTYGGNSGEIDIAEFRTAVPDRVTPFLHYPLDGTDTSYTNDHCMVSRPEDFHTYAVEWTPDTITFLYDGAVCLADSWSPGDGLMKPQPFDQPFTIILNQSLGTGGNAVNRLTPLPATMQVDYVRVWS